MKSGLEDRNNQPELDLWGLPEVVSMKSGLEDRNNPLCSDEKDRQGVVSMKSGLEDRNNPRNRIKFRRGALSQ